MNLMELLLQLDARLRPLVGADERTVQAVVEEVAAGPWPEGVSAEADLRAVLAGQLIGIEEECRMLRERLNVQLTIATRLDVKAEFGPSQPRQAPADLNSPD